MDNSGYQPDQVKNNQENLNNERNNQENKERNNQENKERNNHENLNRNQRNNQYILHDIANEQLKQKKKYTVVFFPLNF
jgi:hypothetical protein